MSAKRLPLLLLGTLTAYAAAPDLKSFLPVAASPGSTNTITLSGSFDPWPPKIWSEPEGLTFVPETNKNKFTLTVATNAAPGPRLARVYNDDGVSGPQFFIVDPSAQLEEKEPNNKLAEAQQPTSLPIAINGRLNGRDDVDNYKIELKKGQWLDASLEAYVLMSKFDGVLRVLTTNGVTLAWNHDYATLDPRVWYQSPRDETVIVQVFGFVYPANNDIRLFGSEESNYRLHLANNPPPEWRDSGKASIDLPLEISNTLTNVGQEDRYEFRAKKDEYVEARLEASRMGSPLDGWLKITDIAGKQLAREDDSDGSRDPRIEWKAPEATNFVLVVGSTLNRAASNYHYRLKARKLGPDYRAVWAANSLLLTNNSTNTIKLDLKRLRGHTNDLVAKFRNLPEGVTASPTELTNGSGDIIFTLSATNASSWQGPIRLSLVDSVETAEKNAIVELTSRGEDNGVPNGYSTLVIESYDHVWLMVRAEPPLKEIAATNAVAK